MPKRSPSAYDKHRDQAGKRQRAQSTAGRDIGHLPPVRDHARKVATSRSFREFCERYFPLKFSLAWSDDHLRMIGRIELAVAGGGLFALAMPRGSGKTTLCEAATLWALLTGRRRFVFLIGSSAEAATACLANLKTELGHNELLLADWPEVCFPISKLEGEARRAGGQLYLGKRTRIGWGADELILPTIPGSPASGSLVRVAGITGQIRGAVHTLETGESIRPDLAILDDPQTDDSAKSDTQNAQRLAVVKGAVLGLAGPGKAIAALMPCTVIRTGDMVDQVLDRVKHPEWHGERTKMVYAWPTRVDLWEQYARLRADSLRAGNEGEEATAYYAAHRAEMDVGGRVAWPERHLPTELSGIQHAYNLNLRDPAAFAAEYQNEPIIEDEAADRLSADAIAGKVNNHARGDIPGAASRLTAFIDVQQNLLYWALVAWGEDFTGWVIDYDAWPQQPRKYFTLREASPTLADIAKGAGKEGAILAGLKALFPHLLGRTWLREDGAPLQVSLALCDANWGDSTDIVYEACRIAGPRAMPSHGKGVTASGQPLDAAKPKLGERVGQGWRVPPLRDGGRKVRHAIYDSNHWKSFIAARWRVAVGDPGSLSLFGDSAGEHRLFSEHQAAEYPVPTEGRGRRVDEWKLPPNKPDNHWWDCLVGAAVAASIDGAKLLDIPTPHATKRKRVSFGDRNRRAA